MWYREPILILLEWLTDDSSASRLAFIIVDALQVHRGLNTKNMKKKFISFSAGRVAVFHVVICHGFSLLVFMFLLVSWCSC